MRERDAWIGAALRAGIISKAEAEEIPLADLALIVERRDPANTSPVAGLVRNFAKETAHRLTILRDAVSPYEAVSLTAAINDVLRIGGLGVDVPAKDVSQIASDQPMVTTWTLLDDGTISAVISSNKPVLSLRWTEAGTIEPGSQNPREDLCNLLRSQGYPDVLLEVLPDGVLRDEHTSALLRWFDENEEP